MKLFRVKTYEEIYFKSLYKPIFYDPEAEKDKTYEKDPAEFVRPVVELASIEDGLWLFLGENEQLYLAEISKLLASVPKPISDAYLLMMKKWFETGPRTPELHQALINAANQVWKVADQAGKNTYVAQRFWESVRSSGVWQALYDKTWNTMNPQLQAVLGKQFAREAADSMTRAFLEGKVSAKEIRAALDRPSVMDLLSKALAPIAALGGILLAQIALLAIAAGCILALIWNPKEWGRKVTHFYEGRHLMVYDEYLWWADMIGRTPKGHYYYHCCEELSAKRLTHKAWYTAFKRGVDEFELTTWPVPEEKVDNWYWLFWPTKIKAVFVGLCIKRTDPLLTVCENFRKNELPPTEPYLDGEGHLKYRRPSWWKEKEGEGCMRPAKDWCKEYYHYEETIPA